MLSRNRYSTTYIIEGLNRQYRKVTKTKGVFPSDVALEKMLYLASETVIFSIDTEFFTPSQKKLDYQK